MGTTWITLAKIAGPLVAEVERLHRRWAAMPGDDDPAVEAQMTALVNDLERHAESPPVVYFARYVDPWTTAAGLYFPSTLAVDACNANSSGIDLTFFRPSAELKRSIQNRLSVKGWKRRFQNYEEYQFANQLHQCLICWEEILETQGVETGIVLAFRGAGGCWLDQEVEAAARTLPDWFRSESRGEGRVGL